MKHLQKFGIGVLVVVALLVPAVSFASGLTNSQITAIVGLLQAFNADQSIILQVQTELLGNPVMPVVNTNPTIVHTSQNNFPVVSSLIQNQQALINQQAQIISTLQTNSNNEVLAGSVPQAPVKKFQVLQFNFESSTNIYLSTNIPTDISSVQFITKDPTNGNIYQIPVIVTSSQQLSPDGKYCFGPTGDCGYPIYRFSISEPLTDFAEQFSSFQVSITGSDGTKLLSQLDSLSSPANLSFGNLNGTNNPWVIQN